MEYKWWWHALAGALFGGWIGYLIGYLRGFAAAADYCHKKLDDILGNLRGRSKE